MKRRITAIMVLLSCLSASVRAQWDVQFSDYTALKSFYNPAVSGTDGLLNVSATYSAQMVGYEGAPSTMYASADLPIYFLSPRHGAGLSFMSDGIGMFNTMKIALQYAFNMKLGKKARLALGVQGALLNESIDPKDLELEDQSDPAFPSSKVSGKSFDLGAGLYFHHPTFWAGLSAQHLLGQTITMNERYEIGLSPVFYFMTGCNLRLKNTGITLHPSAMLQTDLTSWREDIQCKVSYTYQERKLYFGLGYSPTISTTFMIGGDFHGIRLGYSYQLYTSGVGAINGSHEIVLGYQTELDLFKKGRNLHKSVRWL